MTALGTSVLALLCEKPMHPYEMYRLMMERHEGRVVKVRPGSLYHTVARLADASLVEAVGTDREGGRPERTTYRVTPAGRDALRAWITENLGVPVKEYPRFPLALGEAHNLPRAEAIALLRARIDALQADVDESEPLLAEAMTRVQEAHLLDNHYLIAMARAEIGWLTRLVERLETKELTWPSEDRL
ncbi:PadR family transcriptional regulator [Pseudonocardia benzenivorans]|uniref:Transcriptional regulator PadR family protein n=2 Tax=Pseudonocardia TaxID=1847 RepID=F4CQS4_PSEUX|nr:PadR family transcriptional regulator [Pseudonocardia dioxanivorans]AEA23092.1 transcriptional regulator PadR family protein [Pseudonocardia dioxanivorans CB1190]